MTAQSLIATVRAIAARPSTSHVAKALKSAVAKFAQSEQQSGFRKLGSAGQARSPRVDSALAGPAHPQPDDSLPGPGAQPRYHRWLLNSRNDSFQVVVSAWAPRSRSPIHDHDQVPGAVVALAGSPLEQKYRCEETDTDSVILERSAVITLTNNTVSEISSDPDGQVHQIVNLDETWACTLHVYLRRLEHYRVFSALSNNRYRAEARQLWFDAAEYWKVWDAPATQRCNRLSSPLSHNP